MKSIQIILYLCCLAQLVRSQDTPAIGANKPFVLGTVLEMKSTILSERRTLNVYLPDGYNGNDTLRYPVIYLLDGSADEDFIHVTGLVQFLNFPWINTVPKSIVIGIANVDRRRDFTFPTTIEKDKKDFPTTGKSGIFIDFIEKELQPFIEKNYKTAASRTIIGQSLGGLLATEILFKKPYLFTKYVIVSPSLWWNHESLLRMPPAVLQAGFNNKVSIFIAVGKEGSVMEGDTRELVGILKRGNRSNLSVNLEYFTNENHASILHNAVYKALETINKGDVPERK